MRAARPPALEACALVLFSSAPDGRNSAESPFEGESLPPLENANIVSARWIAPPQAGHAASGDSEMLWRVSNEQQSFEGSSAEKMVGSYTYKGMLAPNKPGASTTVAKPGLARDGAVPCARAPPVVRGQPRPKVSELSTLGDHPPVPIVPPDAAIFSQMSMPGMSKIGRTWRSRMNLRINPFRLAPCRIAILLFASMALSFSSCKKKSASKASSASTEQFGQLCTLPPDTASGLALPHTRPKKEFQESLFAFLRSQKYREMKWPRDKRIRDTGPFTAGNYAGTHPAVRVYYSPSVVKWLEGKSVGCIPDGAMIIKEMYYPAPAARYVKNPDAIKASLWTVMVKDGRGARDGWYWSYYDASANQQPDDPNYPFHFPENDFGQYCVRCHASANKELTFSHLDNIEGFSGEPIDYGDDGSWKTMGLADAPSFARPESASHPGSGRLFAAHMGISGNLSLNEAAAPRPPRAVQPAFTTQFPFPQHAQALDKVEKIPGVTHDRRVQGGGETHQFVTSDQCLGCHDGDASPFGVTKATPQGNMIVADAHGEKGLKNVSPYGEWRFSMMGLAGRDPIFFAQMETETKRLAAAKGPYDAAGVSNLCFSCHGAMGQRQLMIDNKKDQSLPQNFDRSMVFHENDPLNPLAKYGALARDGISCMICHQMEENTNKTLKEIATGNFTVVPPKDGLNTVFGPRKDVMELPMVQSIGVKPVQHDFIGTSRVCATCHNVYLPVISPTGDVKKFVYEQATYLEWENSDYSAREKAGEKDRSSCQSCHMPRSFEGKRVDGKIANVEDTDFPDYKHLDHLGGILAPPAKVDVKPREGIARHALNGINLFGLEMFNQFDDILGIRKSSYMSGVNDGLPAAIRNNAAMARNETARVTLAGVTRQGNKVRANVKVENLAGHRFPSGVGFRRAFVEFTVKNAAGETVWASGATNGAGAILNGARGAVLPTEIRTGKVASAENFQPHHRVITRENQAQIYEEVVVGSDGRFTTSFLDIVGHPKDNRLLPLGWKKEGGPGFDGEQVHAIQPEGDVVSDSDFGAGGDITQYDVTLPAGVSGPLTVSAKVFYQSVPPGYLNDRFTMADGPSTKRLYTLAANLVTKGTPIEDWKLLTGSATAVLP